MTIRANDGLVENPRNGQERDEGDMPARLHTQLDPHPNDTLIPGHLLHELLSAKSITEREIAHAKIQRHNIENMEGEKRNFVSKFLHSQWGKYLGFTALGALTLGTGLVAVGDAPDWMGDLWNKVPSWNDLTSSGGNLLDNTTNTWNGMSDLAKAGTVAGGVLAPIGIGLGVRYWRKGSKAQREERNTLVRVLDSEINAIERGHVKIKRESY